MIHTHTTEYWTPTEFPWEMCLLYQGGTAHHCFNDPAEVLANSHSPAHSCEWYLNLYHNKSNGNVLNAHFRL